jgi:hypothetical protein
VAVVIDVADLPPAVQRDVAALPAELTAADAAAQLRVRGARCWQAINGIWPTEQWHQVHEQLGLIGGYLTAATRLEEEATS